MLKNHLISSTFLACCCGLSFLAPSASAASIAVDMELSLLNDFSGSVDTTEYNLTIQGYANAFRNIDFTNTNIAVNFVAWSGGSQQQEIVDWTQITDNASASAFATALETALLPSFGGTRPFSGTTAPGSAINFAVPLFGTETGGTDNGFTSSFQAIDIAGDGARNDGADTATARNNALAAGVDVINGLPILGESGLQSWYTTNVIGGTNYNGNAAFTIAAANFTSFQTSIEQKLLQETDGVRGEAVPEPFTILGSLTALGFGSLFKRKFAKS